MAFLPYALGNRATTSVAKGTPETAETEMVLSLDTSAIKRPDRSIVDEYRNFSFQSTSARRHSNFICNLERHGFNTIGRIYIDPNQPPPPSWLLLTCGVHVDGG